MLSELRLHNFQGFGSPQVIPLKPLTLIYGPNASGKSSILRSLRLLSQSTEAARLTRAGSFVFEGQRISLASFENAVTRHDEDLSMRIGISISFDKPNRFSGPRERLEDSFEKIALDWTIESPGRISYINVAFTPRSGLALQGEPKDMPEDLKFCFANEERALILESCEGAGWLAVLSQAGFAVGSPTGEETLEETNPDGNAFLSSQDWDWQEVLDDARFRLVGIAPYYERPDGPIQRTKADSLHELVRPPRNQTSLLASLFRQLELAIVVSTVGFEYIGPLRDISKRVNFAAPSDDSRFRRQRGVRPAGRKEDETVSKWLERLTNKRYTLKTTEFRAEPVGFLGTMRSETVVDNLTGTQVTFEDVGVGLSQVLPILRSLSDSSPRSLGMGSMLGIEQPELHLHPRMQSGLSDLFADLVSERKNLQVIAETHSETFLMHLQKRLRAGTLDPDKVQILFVDRGPDGNVVTPINLDPGNEFEIDLPVSFARLRLEEFL